MTTPENTLEAPEHAPEALKEEMPNSAAAHMLEFRAPDLDGNGGGEDDVIAVGEDGQPVEMIDTQEVVEQMSKDAFFVVFRHSFGLPGMFMPDFRPLAVQPQEEAMARDASDAIYELLEIYYPGALLPQGDTFARLMIAGPFLLAKVMVVREILNARRRDRMSPPVKATKGQGGTFSTTREKPPQEAPLSANDNAAPADPTAWMADEQEAA